MRVCGLTLQIMDDDAIQFVPSMVNGNHTVTVVTSDNDNVVVSVSVLQKALSAHKSALKKEQKGWRS